MRNDHLGKFLAQSRQRLQCAQYPLSIHGREGFVEEQELGSSRHRPDKCLSESEAKTEGQSLQGSTRQLMRLEKIAFLSREESNLEVRGHLRISITATCQMRKQATEPFSEAGASTHSNRLDGFIEQFQ